MPVDVVAAGFYIERGRDYSKQNISEGRGAGGGRTHIFYAVVIRQLTISPQENGALFLSERFPILEVYSVNFILLND